MGKVEVSIAIATPSDQREIDWIAAEGATIRDIVEDGVKKGVVPRELRDAAVGGWGNTKADNRRSAKSGCCRIALRSY